MDDDSYEVDTSVVYTKVPHGEFTLRRQLKSPLSAQSKLGHGAMCNKA